MKLNQFHDDMVEYASLHELLDATMMHVVKENALNNAQMI